MFWLFVLAFGGCGATGWYQYTGRLRPFRPCKSCDGKGYKPASRRFAVPLTRQPLHVECSACGSTGKRLTWAARHRTRNDTRKRTQLEGRR